MERDSHKAVTSKESFALLIPASLSDAEGQSTFQMEFGSPQLVRAITVQELKKAGVKMQGASGAMFWALLALRSALEAKDALALAAAKERLEHAYRLRESERPIQSAADEASRLHFGLKIASVIGMSAEDSLKHIEGLRPGPRAKADPHKELSFEVSRAVGMMSAEIVLWWWREAFRPAIYCKDIETALYIHSFFLAPKGEVGFRICPAPACSGQFFQDRPNQDYCCPAHREAHRVARWRNEKKRLAVQDGLKGAKNVTEKTR